MNLKKFLQIVVLLLPVQSMIGNLSDIQPEVNQQVKKDQMQQNKANMLQKLHELRNILNERVDKLEDPVVLENIFTVIKILVPLIAFTIVGYKAYRKAFATPKEQLIVTAPMKMPAPSGASEKQVMPSENIAQFFKVIENITPQQLTYLDSLISQLEDKYAVDARLVLRHGFSLISAAIVAQNLDAHNKAELIRWLKSYGIVPTNLDKKRAHSLGETSVIQAINN